MRVLIAALIALLWVAPAAAQQYARLEVVKPTTYKATGQAVIDAERDLIGWLDLLGIDYFFAPPNAITEDIRNGQAVFNRGLASQVVEQADAVWFFEYQRAGHELTSGLYPDSCLHAARWTKVPTVRLCSRTFGSGLFGRIGGSCQTCSTGTADDGAPGSGGVNRAMYPVGRDEVFRVTLSNRYLQEALVADGRYRRGLMGLGASNHGDATFRDAVTRSDSLHMWELFPPPAALPDTHLAFGIGIRREHVPQIMVQGAAGAPVGGHQPTYLALCRLHAVIKAKTGKRLIRYPLQFAITVDDADGTGSPTALSGLADTARVPFVLADSATFRRYFVDSTNALRQQTGLKVPMTLGIGPVDTFLVSPLSRMLKDVPRDAWNVCPMYWRGVLDHSSAATNPRGNAGNTSRLQVNDLWGSKRLHELGEVSASPACAGAGDTTLSCKLKWAIEDTKIALMAAGLPVQISRVWVAPRDDWTDRTVNRTSRSRMRKILSIAYAHGIRGFRVGVMSPTNDGYREETYGPAHGWSSIDESMPVYANPDDPESAVIGQMKMIPSRGTEFDANNAHYYTDHDLLDEAITGRVTGSWYIQHEPMYVNMHQMDTRTYILEIGAATLQGNAPNWSTIKWLAMWLSTGNAFAGEKVGDIVFADRLQLRTRSTTR